MAKKILQKLKKQTWITSANAKIFVVKPSTKGQIVIPKLIRDFLQIDETTKLVFSFNDKQVFFSKQEDDIYSVYGSLSPKSSNQKLITQDQFEKDLEEAKAKHVQTKPN